jgi:hypothetical protein
MRAFELVVANEATQDENSGARRTPELPGRHFGLCGKLLRALVNPGSDQPDLFGREGIAFALGRH